RRRSGWPARRPSFGPRCGRGGSSRRGRGGWGGGGGGGGGRRGSGGGGGVGGSRRGVRGGWPRAGAGCAARRDQQVVGRAAAAAWAVGSVWSHPRVDGNRPSIQLHTEFEERSTRHALVPTLDNCYR